MVGTRVRGGPLLRGAARAEFCRLYWISLTCMSGAPDHGSSAYIVARSSSPDPFCCLHHAPSTTPAAPAFFGWVGCAVLDYTVVGFVDIGELGHSIGRNAL